MRRRPALWTALSFGAGVILAHYVTLPISLLFVLSFLLTLAALVAVLKGWKVSVLLLGVVLVLGALRYQTDTLLLPANHILYNVLCLYGRLWSLPAVSLW